MRTDDDYEVVDDLLYDLIGNFHHDIVTGGFFNIVPVDLDPRAFCENAIERVRAVRPGYIREYVSRHKDASPSRLTLYSLEKIIFVCIKSILHVQVFTPDDNIKETLRSQGKTAFSYLLSPTAHLAAEFVFAVYENYFVKKAIALTPFFKSAHFKEIGNSLIILFDRAKDDWSAITPEFIAYVCYAIRLSHKNVTARTTTQLLARDTLIPLVEGWVDSCELIGLIYVDIDHFSQVNNDNNHNVGDFCLKQIADIVCEFALFHKGACERHGGDEFVIAMPISIKADFDKQVSSLLEGIRHISRPNHNKTDRGRYKSVMSATISYGTIDTHHFHGDSFKLNYDKALSWLDQAVVQSKKEDKRDRVIRV